jgi:hypothetical protein
MIDEIPIIGVTEWTVDGLAAKEFRRRPEDGKMPLRSPGIVWTRHRLSRVGKGRVGDRQSELLVSPLFDI